MTALHITFTVFIFCFYFVCAMTLKLSGLHHVNLDVYNNNNSNNTLYKIPTCISCSYSHNKN